MRYTHSRAPLSDLSPDELRARAAECTEMAMTAGMPGVGQKLLRLAQRFERLAAIRELPGQPGLPLTPPQGRN